MSGIPELAAIASLAGTAVGAVGSITAGQAQANTASFNAQIAQQQAEREKQIAEREAEDFRRRESRVLAAARARRGRSGTTIEGSPLLVDEATAAEIELGAQNTLVWGGTRALRLQQQATLDRSRGRSAMRSGFLNAGSTLLTGVAARI